MKHLIEHNVVINGLIYQNLTEDYKNDAIDFFFDVFLKGKIINLHIGCLKKYFLMYVHYNVHRTRTDEPTGICAASSSDCSNTAGFTREDIADIIEDGVSVIALDPAGNKNKLVGIRLAYTVDR